jgi:hypothetical protein
MVKTLGEAWKLGWRIHAKCLVIGPKPKARERTAIYCDTIAELDMKTLVWTRGEHMPLDAMHERLKCPKCGNRKITVFFDAPNQPAQKRAAQCKSKSEKRRDRNVRTKA